MTDSLDNVVDKHNSAVESQKHNAGLSRAGYKQAYSTAKQAEHSFTSIHSSPMKRTRDTAYIVARRNPKAGHIKVTANLLPAAHPLSSESMLGHVQSQLNNLHADPKPLNITHSHTLHALREALTGEEGGAISHASLHRLNPETLKLTHADKADKPGVYFMRHAEDVDPEGKKKSK